MDGARRSGERKLSPPAPLAASPIHLVVGDPSLAEPKAVALAEQLAGGSGLHTLARHRESLTAVLDDLETYSLFNEPKVVVAFESALLADKSAAAALIDAALDDPITDSQAELSSRQRWGATRLYNALRMHGIDPFAGSAAEAIGGLPDKAFKGASGRIGAARVEERRRQLQDLLEAARAQEVPSHAEAVLDRLIAIVDAGLPEGHHLILVESAVNPDHPLAARLKKAEAVLAVGEITAGRGGDWQGLEPLLRELERETGVGIDPAAASELARRTLKRKPRDRSGSVDSETTARFVAEYRKLASLAEGAISRADVQSAVVDRGDQDVFRVLDAVGEGQTDRALSGLARLVDASEDPVAARLGFFSQLAQYCRHMAWIDRRLQQTGVERGLDFYPRFKQKLAPVIASEDGIEGLRSLHPFRLHRAYLAASRLAPGAADTLAGKVLETERRLKGDSRVPELALDVLVAEFCALIRGQGGGQAVARH